MRPSPAQGRLIVLVVVGQTPRDHATSAPRPGTAAVQGPPCRPFAHAWVAAGRRRGALQRGVEGNSSVIDGIAPCVALAKRTAPSIEAARSTTASLSARRARAHRSPAPQQHLGRTRVGRWWPSAATHRPHLGASGGMGMCGKGRDHVHRGCCVHPGLMQLPGTGWPGAAARHPPDADKGLGLGCLAAPPRAWSRRVPMLGGSDGSWPRR